MNGNEIVNNNTWEIQAGNFGNPVTQGNLAAQDNPISPAGQGGPINPPVGDRETEHTRRMKQNFRFFGPVTFLYAAFYAFCMFHNGSGVTFPFFMAGSLLYLCCSLSKLEISLKKGSVFYMIGMMLLAVSTFCTDDGRIIAFNKMGIFLLMMSLLLKQFFDTANWKLGKYLLAICELVFVSLGEIYRPFSDAVAYRKAQGRKSGKAGYVALGLLIAMPLLLIVLALLGSADVVFRNLTDIFWQNINLGNLCNIGFRIVFLFFAAYMLTAYLCKHRINEKVGDYRIGEPVLAITVNSLLTVIYLVFSCIQIVYLFWGKMQLPEGYTYAAYAREGFFQLLAVSILNLVIVLVSVSFFKENGVLKAILTVMSLCTFIMIASSAMRMILYIWFYDLTFLRILVLWGLALLFVLFVGVIISIYSSRFPLFRYSMAVVTVLYLALSFSHPDYIIAAVNLSNAEEDKDWSYLSGLSADAAPVLIPYLEELGYDLESFYIRGERAERWDIIDEQWEDLEGETQDRCIAARLDQRTVKRSTQDGFGYYYLRNLQLSTDNFGIRTYNISRHMALRQIDRACHKEDR
ncbi:MAG: DUF4173 domain-containing protein [Clostridium sp.]|nr:DUF4173 domain-containing protein [Acetatifactor muris]MCM1528180.1 DUF4173 domain-containing protein [Bacteroides sp.]MCM1564118.1 DUF4173 domain-containing protein [Clostridium sp.]